MQTGNAVEHLYKRSNYTVKCYTVSTRPVLVVYVTTFITKYLFYNWILFHTFWWVGGWTPELPPDAQDT